MKCNVGGTDRAVRILLGLVLIPVGYFALSGVLAWLAYAVGAIGLVTGVVRFCPANALFGVDTCT
jgi:hypothetical protein